MCGIFGAISSSIDIVDTLLEGISKLEYRGYDSCGIAILDKEGYINIQKSCEKISNLRKIIHENLLSSTIGIAHTRWATHGIVNIKNAHPLNTSQVAIVHNGIIENYIELKENLQKEGVSFYTETDTEVIPHIITQNLNSGLSPIQAVYKSINQLQGSFAIIALFRDHSNLLIATKRGSSLAIGGYNDNIKLIASDSNALRDFTQEITYLEDDDIAVIDGKCIYIYHNNQLVKREINKIDYSIPKSTIDQYSSFMLKEIFEQPYVLKKTIFQFINAYNQINITNLNLSLLKDIKTLTIIGCGSSYFAGLIAKYWLEEIAKVRVHLEISSEFRYSNVTLPEGGIVLFISQSGETADTLEAMKFAKSQKQIIISLTNTKFNSMEKLSDIVLHTLADIEIGVASTKTFTTQLAVIACLTLAIANAKNINNNLLHHLKLVPEYVERTLNLDGIDQAANIILKHNKAIIIGRGSAYGVAMESALKIREVSYVNTIGIAAGEMKHGSIALVDENHPVIAIAPYDNLLFPKITSNIQEIKSRNGMVIVFTDKRGSNILQGLCNHIVELPSISYFISPIIYTIPMQLLAYTIANKKQLNADQPRNLAKSVTVE